ncbi:hypothetical protein FGO68_gene2499 [Halteria grandinella]|uniref:Uncharacterized protein n=1 Tax=Halteria grandinella TaxID=5974 RepID=A0A8J8P0S2_HALGN|nr:hypothetical protein FGO68_gene2499 [Halteria grandinella]
MWAIQQIKHNQNYNPNEFSFEFQETQLAFPFLNRDFLNIVQFDELSRLKHFFQFLDQIDGLKRIYFSKLNIRKLTLLDNFDGNNIPGNYSSLQLKAYMILKQVRESMKIILFSSCNFYADYTTSFPIIYPAVEQLFFADVKFNNKAEIGHYNCLKVINFQKCSIYEFDYEDGKITYYKWRNKDITFDIIFKFIINSLDHKQTTSVNILNADVYFENSLQCNYPWPILAQIRDCNFWDTETVFTFQMFHTLISYTTDLENTSSLPPIYLEISKLSDWDQSMSPEISGTLELLRELANLRGLIIKNYRINANENKEINNVVLLINLKSLTGRALKLKINWSKYIKISSEDVGNSSNSSNCYKNQKSQFLQGHTKYLHNHSIISPNKFRIHTDCTNQQQNKNGTTHNFTKEWSRYNNSRT